MATLAWRKNKELEKKVTEKYSEDHWTWSFSIDLFRVTAGGGGGGGVGNSSPGNILFPSDRIFLEKGTIIIGVIAKGIHAIRFPKYSNRTETRPVGLFENLVIRVCSCKCLIPWNFSIYERTRASAKETDSPIGKWNNNETKSKPRHGKGNKRKQL